MPPPEDLQGEPNISSIAEDGSEGLYQDLQTTIVYVEEQGDEAIPVAGPPGTPCVVVNTHAKTWTKIVRWTAMKAGGPPKVPNRKTLGGNDVYLRGNVGIAAPMPNAQYAYGGEIWSLSGEYVYATRTPPGDLGDSDLPSAKLPVVSRDATAYRLPASAFDTTLLDGYGG